MNNYYDIVVIFAKLIQNCNNYENIKLFYVFPDKHLSLCPKGEAGR